MRFFISFLLAAFINAANAHCQTIDDTGQTLTLAAPAKRVITLAPDLTEILYSIGAGERLIATVDSSDYPKAAKNLARIGSYTGLDLERIVFLHPDLIVTWDSNFARQLTILKTQFGIPIYTVSPHQLVDIPRTMENLGCLLNLEPEAKKAAKQFLTGLYQLEAKYSSQPKITAFYQIGAYGLMTINKTSWINQVLTLCGGKNVFANVKTMAPQITWEALLANDPQVIIGSDVAQDWKRHFTQFPQLTAVKQQTFYTVDPNLIHRAGPRLLQGAQQICLALALARQKMTN